MNKLRQLCGVVCASLILLAGCAPAGSATSAEKKDAPAKAAADKDAENKSVDADAQPSEADAARDTKAKAKDAKAGKKQTASDPADESRAAESSDDELPELTIGKPAPQLKIQTWVKGEPVEKFSPGKVTVVEFWATWCGPCIASMPHMSELQKKYGDKVRFIGITDEPEETVREFLEQEQSEGKSWDETIAYTLATDDKESTSTAYLRAAEQPGIPSAFIVGRNGEIEWIGHPMAIDEPIAQVVDGKWDRAAAIAELRQKRKVEKAMERINIAAAKEDWDEALRIIDELIAGGSKELQLKGLKHAILMQTGKHKEADKVLAEIVEQEWENARVLNAIGFNIAKGKEPRDLKLAMKAAKRANELTKGKEASMLDTVALIYHEQGNLDEAIAWQKKAVAAGKDIPELAETLKQFEDEKAGKKDDKKSNDSESKDDEKSTGSDDSSEDSNKGLREGRRTGPDDASKDESK